jgi:outer membrane protein OmpA-like peptidoglycan-associated protein
MISAGHILKSLSIVAVLATAACAGQQKTNQTPSGTYSVTYDNVGGLIGFHTGKGRIVLNDGSEYAFKADGYSLAGLGYSVATATGRVYNLRKPEDLSGEYSAVGGAAILGHGGGKAGLRNRSNDVVLDVDSDETGLRFGIGGGFVTFKLGDRLKGPRVAAVEPAPPTPAPVKPATPAKPMSHSIEFGYDKSRISIAIGKQLDPIAADWRNKPVTFDVIGHADTAGTDAYNTQLSERRAGNVKNALVERGIPADRITANGVGEAGLAVQRLIRK